MEANRRLSLIRTKVWLAWAALLALPVVAWANPPTGNVPVVNPEHLVFSVFWLMEVAIFLVEAFGYHYWLTITGGRALATSALGNLASLSVGSFTLLLLSDNNVSFPMLTTAILQWVVAVLLAEFSIVLLLNRDYKDKAKLIRIVFLLNLATYAALMLAMVLAGAYKPGDVDPLPLSLGPNPPLPLDW